jgi:hypothetical protein
LSLAKELRKRTLADEGSGGNDGEPDAEPVDNAAEQGDNLVPEQRGKGYNDEDSDGY